MLKKALFEDPPSASSSEEDDISSEEEQSMEPNPSQEHRSGKAHVATLSKKRQNEGTSTKVSAKRANKKSAGTSRVWSDEDEIKLLQHLIDFHSETGTSPFEDKLGFFNFLKNDISFAVKKSQVDDKIRGIKNKYIRNRNYRLGQAHDDACLRLVKDIWGHDGTDLLTSKNVVQQEEENNDAHNRRDTEVFTRNGQGTGKKVLVDDEVLFRVGECSGKKIVEEDEGLGHGGGGSGDKVVQGEGQGLARGGGNSDWFEKSVFVKSLTMFGVAEQTVKERWSSFSPESKKKLEQKWKSLESKKLEVVSLEFEITSDIASELVKSTERVSVI